MVKIKLIGCLRYTINKELFEARKEDGTPKIYMVSPDKAEILLGREQENGMPYFTSVGVATIPTGRKRNSAPPEDFDIKVDSEGRRMYDDDGKPLAVKDRDDFMDGLEGVADDDFGEVDEEESVAV